LLIHIPARVNGRKEGAKKREGARPTHHKNIL
jgi:hypothetical protein